MSLSALFKNSDAIDVTKPESSGGSLFLRFEADKTTRVRVVGEGKAGYVCFDEAQRKTIRNTVPFQGSKIAWLLPVYDYDAKAIKLWEISQAKVKNQIRTLSEDEDWGDLRSFDMKVTRTGTGKETDYAVVPGSKCSIKPEILKMYEDSTLDEIIDDFFTPDEF